MNAAIPAVHYTSRLSRMAFARPPGLGVVDAPDLPDVPNFEDAPGRAEVDQYMNELEGYMPDVPVDWNNLTPAAAQAWAEQAISNWAEENNVPLTRDELELAARGWIEEEIGVTLPTSVQNARDMGIDLAVTAACTQLGIDPRAGVATVEALSDGDFDEEDCIAIGRMAGSIAGAAVGQMFGIPAPIGAYFGGTIGAVIGEIVGGIFGLGEDAGEAKEREREARWAAIQEWYGHAQAQCGHIRHSVRANQQLFVNTLIETWLELELQIGMRFDLRWFGARTYFEDWKFAYTWNPTNCWQNVQMRREPPYWRYYQTYRTCQQGEGGACKKIEDDTGCTRWGVVCKRHTRSTKLNGWGTYSYTTCRCDEEYGCAYPEYEQDWAHEREIVAKVYSAIGKPYESSQCSLEPPQERYAGYAPDMHAWMDRVSDAIRREAAENYPLMVRYSQVGIDLLRTAAMVQSEKQVAESHVELAVGGTETLRAALHKGRKRRMVVNGGAMLLGLSLLGYALLRRRK
jgi:hypothetical protein